MSELADFDSSIQPSDIVEPTPARSRHVETKTVTHDDDDIDYPKRHISRRSASPPKIIKQVFYLISLEEFYKMSLLDSEIRNKLGRF